MGRDKELRFPIPIYPIKNRKIDYRVLLWVILISNRDNNDSNKVKRYLYLNKLNKHSSKILKNLNIKKRSLKDKINALCDEGVMDYIPDCNKYYEIFCKNIYNENEYILLTKSKIKHILNSELNSNEIKVYLIITDILIGKEEEEISRRELIERTGLSIRTISTITNKLSEKQFIDINKENIIYSNNRKNIYRIKK